jgi:murein L,D-transpeptidase YcbB/YkuD
LPYTYIWQSLRSTNLFTFAAEQMSPLNGIDLEPLNLKSAGFCMLIRSLLLPCLQLLIALPAMCKSGPPTLLWSTSEGPTRQATAFLAVLHSAETYGLRSSDYNVDPLLATEARPHGSSPDERIRFDLAMSAAAAHFIHDLHYGRITPQAAGFDLPNTRADLDVPTAVAAIAAGSDIARVLSAVEPRFYHYALLKASLPHYRALAAVPNLTVLPNVGRHSLRAGDSYAGAPALRRLLIALGDMPAGSGSQGGTTTLDDPVVEALKRFQQRHGLTPDGTLGRQTMAVLTTPLAQRVRQIELTLERWRWVPNFDTPPILVNIPQFELFAFHTTQDRVADITEIPVIVGQAYPRTRTPVFVGDLAYIIFRPYWNVPRNITVQEMLPAIRARADYLQRNHLELVRGQGDDSPVVAPTADAIAELATGKLRLRQRPGEDNALGLIKFVLPNSHDVYLHSTPAHALFRQSRRAFSHGCIRVSDPIALASYVLRNTPGGWDADRILAAMHTTTPSRVNLAAPIRVMILYGTALATEAGSIEFFDDIYGHDRKLESLLGLEPIHR